MFTRKRFQPAGKHTRSEKSPSVNRGIRSPWSQPSSHLRTRFILQQCIGDAVDVNVVFPEPDLFIEKTQEAGARTCCTKTSRSSKPCMKQPWDASHRLAAVC